MKGTAPPPWGCEGLHSGAGECWRNVQPTLVAQIQLCHHFIIAVSQSFILFTSETLSSLRDWRQVKGAFVVCTWNNQGGDWSVSYINLKPLNIHWGHWDVTYAETSIQSGVEALSTVNCFAVFVCCVVFSFCKNVSFVLLLFVFLVLFCHVSVSLTDWLSIEPRLLVLVDNTINNEAL